jgi:CubicO group peptidase (beta-lactamase class C family)
MRKLSGILIVAVITGALSAQSPQFLSDLEAYIGEVMEEFEVPGLALSVVKDGSIIVAKGYGVRELGSSVPVNEQTLFGIASNSKAFTATALALLVEEGRLEWDAPVINYLPWFQLSDPYVTRELTIRDLLVHRSGIPLGGGDLLWWPPSIYDRKEITRRLRFVPLTTSFRSRYAYDNVLYLVAGEVIETVTGQTWEEYVKSRILEPVGMNLSIVFGPDVHVARNISNTHANVDGEVRKVKPFLQENSNPAAGIMSNADDMARWMIVQLDSGRIAENRSLFTKETTRQLWSIVTPIPIGTPPPGLELTRPNFNGYALGFGVRDYRGRMTVSHGGSLPGYVSRLTMLPEIKLGIAVLTNQESNGAILAITNHIIDHFLYAPFHDWLAAYKSAAERSDSINRAAEQTIETARDTASQPSLPLSAYAGTYRDVWYGDMTITIEEGRPVIRFSATPTLTGDLVFWQHNSFIARWHDRELRADAYVTFHINPDGSIEQVVMKAVSPATDFSFNFHDLLFKPVRPKIR